MADSSSWSLIKIGYNAGHGRIAFESVEKPYNEETSVKLSRFR